MCLVKYILFGSKIIGSKCLMNNDVTVMDLVADQHCAKQVIR